ncbi:hypothetical protein SAMN06297387_12441 [Streptomyces zhaozhouensis]|uniref:Uncharacterized protein n=1 Tax=Streptomyces zhaozhouensis TaxID=1300267 RepID=A0A286E556_9ACTN|nr:hypothetical protein [Streptomyces zhaozhouensis]SOD66026.1 hypothetical protein SAMN06297387_12441 [Streptomyces zhaozhouensis]
MNETTNERIGSAPTTGGATTGGLLARTLQAVRVFGAAAFDVVIMGRDGLPNEAGVRRPA